MAHILIADTDQTSARMASETLISGGHACGWVSDSQQALDLLKWRTPDVMLLDEHMPPISGYTLLQKLRRLSWMRDMPIIILSAVGHSEDTYSMRFEGAQDTIRKPLNGTMLIWRVNQMLKSRGPCAANTELRSLIRRNVGQKPAMIPDSRRVM